MYDSVVPPLDPVTGSNEGTTESEYCPNYWLLDHLTPHHKCAGLLQFLVTSRQQILHKAYTFVRARKAEFSAHNVAHCAVM